MISYIEAIPAFSDNYIWIIVKNDEAAIVDPGDASVVEDFLKKKNLKLKNILITHHHFDHTGGVLELIKNWNPEVFGPKGGHIKGIDNALEENDSLKILDSNFIVYETPGHTLDHIAFYHSGPDGSFLFCGDTLFSGGCGRLFEGTAENMYKSLEKFISLPEETLVFCAHEYTLSNLKFALSINPNNSYLVSYSNKVDELRSKSKITLPSTIGLEKKINPFFLLKNDEILNNCETFLGGKITNQIESLAAIRSMKDSF